MRAPRLPPLVGEGLAVLADNYPTLQAVESLNKICGELSPQQVEEYFVPLTIRLSKADWFTSKVSGCGLYTAPYSKVSPPVQQQLRHQFGQLVHDDTPMVRRQAATNLAKFVKEMPAAIVVEEMIPMFQHLVQDDQDSVRLLTVEVLISIAEVVPKEQQSSHGVLLTSLRSLIEDKSWRVRYMIADRFEKVCEPRRVQFLDRPDIKLASVDCQGGRRGGRCQGSGSGLRKTAQRQRGRGADRDCWPDPRLLRSCRPQHPPQRHYGYN